MSDLENDWAFSEANFEKIQTSFENFKMKSQEMFKAQDECVKSIASHKKGLNELLDSLNQRPTGGNRKSSVASISPSSESPLSEERKAEIKLKLNEQLAQLKPMELAFPQKKSLLLRLVLGDVNMTLPKMGDRFKYKTEYENFKLKMTVITALIAAVNLFVLRYRFMEALFNMLIVWFYCVATLREHILIANGSRIRGWWLFHHYCSIVLSGVLLIWPDGYTYQEFRNQFLVFSIYVGGVQFLQFQYQTSRLYMLRALGKTDVMEVTTEATARGLTYLVPCLLFGHAFQFYNCYTLYKLSQHTEFAEWQVSALAILFFILGTGNIITLSRTLIQKIRGGGHHRATVKKTE